MQVNTTDNPRKKNQIKYQCGANCGTNQKGIFAGALLETQRRGGRVVSETNERNQNQRGNEKVYTKRT